MCIQSKGLTYTINLPYLELKMSQMSLDSSEENTNIPLICHSDISEQTTLSIHLSSNSLHSALFAVV